MHPPFPSFAAIEMTANKVLTLAKERAIHLRNIEVITTSEIWDKTLGVFFFYDTDAELILRNSDGTSERLKQEFITTLESSKSTFPFHKMPENINFNFDSHSNVVQNYGGNYFLRLR